MPEQVGIGSKHLFRSVFSLDFPQQQLPTLPGASSHSPHGPGWQGSRQW